MSTRARLVATSVVVGAISLVALLAPWLAPYDPLAQLDLASGRVQPPSWNHPLGTDLFSRDLLSRLLHGARFSLGIAALAVFTAAVLGTTVGLLAGWFGGWIETILMRLVDAGLAIPRVFAALLVLALWDAAGPLGLIVVLGVTGWFGTARLVRADVLSLRHRDFVLALEALGATPRRILTQHIVPHVLPPVIVTATIGVGQVILLESGLAFLGVGLRPPAPSWGAIIREGTTALASAPWIALSAGVALVLTVTALSALGDALRDRLDPRTR
jgi:peptide/nickel transport system permease protein